VAQFLAEGLLAVHLIIKGVAVAMAATIYSLLASEAYGLTFKLWRTKSSNCLRRWL
jgi:hypothetical protein